MDVLVSPHLTVFSRSSRRIVDRLGRDGKGYGQLSRPTCSIVVDHDKSEVQITDVGTRGVSTIRIGGRGESRILPKMIAYDDLECAVRIGAHSFANANYPDRLIREMDASGKLGNQPIDAPAFPSQLSKNRKLVAALIGGSAGLVAYASAPRVSAVNEKGEVLSMTDFASSLQSARLHFLPSQHRRDISASPVMSD